MLSLIAPMRSGRVYGDPQLTVPVVLDDVLEQVTAATGVLVISDAGAARRKFDAFRLVDTVALLKAVGTGDSGAGGSGVAWLNPAPQTRWPRTTAAAIARYVPMYPFTRTGLDQAVDALRGRPVPLLRGRYEDPMSAELLDDLRASLGAPALRLACHAALPVAVDPGLLNLLRVNFFLDPPDVLPFEHRGGMLLSPLFREIGESLYEIDADMRGEFLASLYRDFGVERVRRVASLLEQYTDASGAWRTRPSLDAAQRLTALSVLDPAAADRWLEENELRSQNFGPQLGEAWQVAMRQRVTHQHAAAATAVRESDQGPDEIAAAESGGELAGPAAALEMAEAPREPQTAPASSTASWLPGTGISYAEVEVAPTREQLASWHGAVSGNALQLAGICPACAHETATDFSGVSAFKSTGTLSTPLPRTITMYCECDHMHPGGRL